MTGDGFEDIIAAAGPGGGPHVKVFDGRSGGEVMSLFAYAAGFQGGVFVAAADVNHDGFADIIVGTTTKLGFVIVYSGKDFSTTADFFAPFDATSLDNWDADFGSGGIVGLPNAYFGTPSIPHLAVAVGKEGFVYLLNRDNLGGYEQGSGNGDKVVQRLGAFGGVWGRPGVWPGDGGYIYVPTSTGPTGAGGELDVYKYGVSGSGTPSLATAGAAPGMFGWGSGSPVITSDGTASGSALVWTVWSADRTGASDYAVTGDLTIRGVTRTVALGLRYLGRWRTPYNEAQVTRVGFTGETKINRHEFGVNWTASMENAGLVVASEVLITVDVEAILDSELQPILERAVAREQRSLL